MDFKKNLKDVEQKIELQMFDVKGRTKQAAGGIAGQLHLNEGGRVPMIFGGSAGLRALIARLRGEAKTLFPKPSRKATEFGKLTIPKATETLKSLNLQQLENLLDALKIDKKTLAHNVKVKQMNDPGLNFLMGKLDEAGLKAPNLGKYTDIDKDIMVVEQILKNKMMKGRKPQATGGIAGQLHLNRPGYANGKTAGWELVNPDKEPRELTPEEIKEARKKWLEWLEKRKKVEDSLELSQELPEELPPYQGPDYETNIPKEAGKEIIRRIIGGGHKNPPIGGGFAFDVPYGEGKPYDYGIQYQPGGSDFSTYYGIKEDGENVYGGGYQGETFGAGVRKEEGAEPTFSFQFKKKLKKKKKILGKAKGGRASYTKGGLAKILGV